MAHKALPVLTAGVYQLFDNLRRTLEVFSGKTVNFYHLDFNTGRGSIILGTDSKNLLFGRVDPIEKPGFMFLYEIHFTLSDLQHRPDWKDGECIARIYSNGDIWVRNPAEPIFRSRDKHEMWLIGSSVNDRREHPVDQNDVNRGAWHHNLSVEDYLKT